MLAFETTNPSDLTALVTALTVFVSTIVGAVIALKNAFKKVGDKIDQGTAIAVETHKLVNSQLTRVIDVVEAGSQDARDQRDTAQAEVRNLRKE